MHIITTRFGEVDIADEKVITFEEGVLGLEHLRRFTIISSEDTWPFYWIQAIDDPDIALCIINPIQIFADYAPHVSQTTLDEMGIQSDDDIVLYTVAVVPRDFMKMTTNLAAPILINRKLNKGMQIILDSRDFELRRPIYQEIQALVNAGGDA